jgi:CRP-like cAMP-binding protein
MMGELLGLDAISSGRHLCDAIALEDTEVCDIPFGMLERLSREIPALQQHLDAYAAQASKNRCEAHGAHSLVRQPAANYAENCRKANERNARPS